MIKNFLFTIFFKNRYSFLFNNLDFYCFFNYFFFFDKNQKFKILLPLSSLDVDNHNKNNNYIYFNNNNSFYFLKNFFFFKYFIYRLNFDLNFLIFYTFKMHGINMRFFKWSNCFFFRFGYSHGFFFKNCFKNLIVYIYKKRYLFLLSNNFVFLNNLVFYLKTLKKFFRYKLIGFKLERDTFQLKVGKKKIF